MKDVFVDMGTLMMALLGVLGAGRILGLDGVIERWQPIQHIRPLQYALG